MKTTLRISIFSALLLPFAIVQTAFAGSISGCTNGPNTPVDFGPPTGVVQYTNFTCTLYASSSSYNIDLTLNMSFGGANASDNYVGPGYLVVITGDPTNPTVLPDNSTGLWNQSLWDAVLYWAPDQDAGTASDSLTAYWPGSFPSVSTVQALDVGILEPYYLSAFSLVVPDSDFFVEDNFPNVTVYEPNAPGPGGTYNIETTPDQTPLLLLPLLGTGFFGLAGVLRRKLRG
jgi:hypothetical protein